MSRKKKRSRDFIKRDLEVGRLRGLIRGNRQTKAKKFLTDVFEDERKNKEGRVLSFSNLPIESKIRRYLRALFVKKRKMKSILKHNGIKLFIDSLYDDFVKGQKYIEGWDKKREVLWQEKLKQRLKVIREWAWT